MGSKRKASKVKRRPRIEIDETTVRKRGKIVSQSLVLRPTFWSEDELKIEYVKENT